jgi:hypothetical protein
LEIIIIITRIIIIIKFLNLFKKKKKKNSFNKRRNLEASQRFCVSNHIDKITVQCINNYYKYLNLELNNQNEANDFQMLSNSLKIELVLECCWNTLKNKFFLNTTDFDQVNKYIFLKKKLS